MRARLLTPRPRRDRGEDVEDRGQAAAVHRAKAVVCGLREDGFERDGAIMNLDPGSGANC